MPCGPNDDTTGAPIVCAAAGGVARAGARWGRVSRPSFVLRAVAADFFTASISIVIAGNGLHLTGLAGPGLSSAKSF